jgi:hypothetical protein
MVIKFQKIDMIYKLAARESIGSVNLTLGLEKVLRLQIISARTVA